MQVYFMEATMARRKPNLDDVVGVAEIADRLGVKPYAVRMWRSNRPQLEFPEPDWTIGGNPQWWWPTVEKWARKTGRIT